MAEIFRDLGKAAWKISGSRISPAHGREWVDFCHNRPVVLAAYQR
jgi:hypothetical protein